MLHFLMNYYTFSRPCQLQNAINVAESRDPQERSLFAAQAAKDWSTTLLQRAKELVPGPFCYSFPLYKKLIKQKINHTCR